MRGGNYHTRVPLPYFPVLWGCELLRLMICEINVDIRRDLLHLPRLHGHCPEVQSSRSTLRSAQIHATQCELSTIAMIQHAPGETVLSVLLILPQVNARIQSIPWYSPCWSYTRRVKVCYPVCQEAVSNERHSKHCHIM